MLLLINLFVPTGYHKKREIIRIIHSCDANSEPERKQCEQKRHKRNQSIFMKHALCHSLTPQSCELISCRRLGACLAGQRARVFHVSWVLVALTPRGPFLAPLMMILAPFWLVGQPLVEHAHVYPLCGTVLYASKRLQQQMKSMRGSRTRRLAV